MKKRLSLSFFSLLICIVSWSALPTTGKYYRFSNARNGNVLTEDIDNKTLVCRTQGKSTDYKQIWQLNANGGLQNVYTHHYVQEKSGASTQFLTGTTSARVTFTETAGKVLIRCGNYLHNDASNNVVVWNDTEATGNHWTFEEVTLTADELEKAYNEYHAYEQEENAFNTMLGKLQKQDYTSLSTFFEDNACTAMKETYKGMSDAELRKAVAEKGLPEQIQDITVKVKNGWTDETDAAISSQFRIQDYQAYSAAGPWRWRNVDEATNKCTGLEASQINDMCNPTGIYTTGRDVLFVFVEDDIPTGCTLRLSAVDEGVSGFGYNNYDNGQELKKGINIVACDNNLREHWIMYSVTNKNLKPADMPKLKIHIEGGHVMGYVNVQGKDEDSANAEYQKVLLAANKSAEAAQADKCRLRLAVKGNYGMFYFQIMCYNRIWSDGSDKLMVNKPKVASTFESERWTSNYKQGFKIWKSMRFYDSVLKWEWSLMGFMKEISEATKDAPLYHCYGGEDVYPTYCNNLAYAIMGTQGGNPHSSTGYTHMPGIGAVESSYNAERPDFDTWCVGHESGHNNQGSINLESSTESSNNLFSNVITYLYGYRMSRGGTFADNMAYTAQDVVFSWRDIGMTMRMYYNLYLYYHRAGHKQDFYPTLFTNLRRDPIRMGTTASTSWLHFYKKACEAAQEDLTEYFRHWGFFIPVDKGEFGDYTNRTVTCTQADIDEAIAWVKSQGWPENKAIIFIEDRVQPVERTDIWAKAGNLRPDNTGTMRDASYLHQTYGDLGHFTEFMPGNIQNATDYTYTVSGQEVKMTGKGGVGFNVYDTSGKVCYRSNKFSFKLPAELASTPFVIKAVNADGSEAEASNETGTEQYREALQNAISDAQVILALSDATGTKMGYYSAEQTGTLKQLVEEGKNILAGNDEKSYLGQYNTILGELLRIKNEESVQKVADTGIYTIQSNRNKTLYLDGQNTLTATASKNEQQQWAFIATKTADTYYIQNLKTYRFMAPVIDAESSKLTGWTVSTENIDEAGTFTLENAGDGTFYIKTNDVSKGNYYINCDPQGALAIWSADAGSKWNIARVNEIEVFTDKELKALATETGDLIEQVCTYTVKNEPITVQTTDKDAPFYLTSNATTGIDEAHPIDNLLDGKNTTYFSTVGATVKAKRFLTLTLGQGNELCNLRFFYRTAPSMHTYKPSEIIVKAGESTSKLNTLSTLNDMPVSTTAVEAYTSPVCSASTPAKVWRFIINKTNDADGGGYPDFALAQMKFYNVLTLIEQNAGYEGVSKDVIKTAKEASDDIFEYMKNKTTALTNYYRYTSLKAAFDALSEAMATGIEDITLTHSSNKRSGIFDLSGRRIKTPIQSGLYIINGKKILTK